MPNGSPDTDTSRAGTLAELQARIDTSVAHPARRYNYWLGGKDNFPADRWSAEQIEGAFPTIRTTAMENRAFLRRTVGHLAALGVRQFLDIGTGIPGPDNTHEVAQAVAPDTRVLYVDNDPIVLVHARALLAGNPRGRTAYLDADLRDAEAILASPEVRDVLDLSQPVGLLLVAILHFLLDADDPYAVVTRLVNALAPGSYLVISHGTADHMHPAQRDAVAAHTRAAPQAQLRSGIEISRFFTGLDLLEPGLVSVADWRPDRPEHTDRFGQPERWPTAAEVSCYGAVGHKPPSNGA